MIFSKIVTAVAGVAICGTVAFNALDFTPCSTYQVSIVNPVVYQGERILIQILGNRKTEGCRVITDYWVYDAANIPIKVWRTDVKSPGPKGTFGTVQPVPVDSASPGEGRVDIAVSFVKNPIQQVLYSLTGWTSTLPPIEAHFTIKPTKEPTNG